MFDKMMNDNNYTTNKMINLIIDSNYNAKGNDDNNVMKFVTYLSLQMINNVNNLEDWMMKYHFHQVLIADGQVAYIIV